MGCCCGKKNLADAGPGQPANEQTPLLHPIVQSSPRSDRLPDNEETLVLVNPTKCEGSPMLQDRRSFSLEKGKERADDMGNDIRETPWGKVCVIRPGIAVDVIDENWQYVEEIRKLLDAISKVSLGRELLDEFNPRRNVFKTLSQDNNFPENKNHEHYKDVTVVFTVPREGKPIETQSFKGWDPDHSIFNRWKHESPTIPFVHFPNPQLGFSQNSEAGEVRLTNEGLQHPDFDEPEPLDIVVFHELCHAYYDQLGATEQLRKVSLDNTSKKGTALQKKPFEMGADNQTLSTDGIENNVEEQIVVGILAGKGVKYCENNYRVQCKRKLRTKYQAVKIMQDEELDKFVWPNGDYKEPSIALIENGYPVDASKFRR